MYLPEREKERVEEHDMVSIDFGPFRFDNCDTNSPPIIYRPLSRIFPLPFVLYDLPLYIYCYFNINFRFLFIS